MSKSAKKTASVKPASKKQVPPKQTAATIPLDAKITVVKAENPFREGTAVYKRVQAVLASKGKTVEYAVKHGAKRSTVKWLQDHKIVRVAA